MLEPNYNNKYPPMGLMKLSTYYRKKKDDVRFFKGELRNFVTSLLIEEFLSIYPEIHLKLHTPELIEYIKQGKNDLLNGICFNDPFKLDTLKDYRTRLKNEIYPKFDIVCVTTLFTFYWQETIETINFAKKLCKNKESIFVGGIAASIVPEYIERETGIKPHVGLLDKPGILEKGDQTIIDELPLDYSILDEVDYKYPSADAYFAYSTRGCIRKCNFCAVPTIEPKYHAFISIKNQIKQTRRKFGEKKDLLLMDNNVLASKYFNDIIDEIKAVGFKRGAKYTPTDRYNVAFDNLKKRYNIRAMLRVIFDVYEQTMSLLDPKTQGKLYLERERFNCLSVYTLEPDNVIRLDQIFRPIYMQTLPIQHRRLTRHIDFNQGVDARLITPENMKKLAEINIRPLRIAFDNWRSHKVYEYAVECAVKAGIKHLSNYMLYNFNDEPKELWQRLNLNLELCEKFQDQGVSIYSFPMKYHPIKDQMYFRNREYIGTHWNRKYIRAVQAVLNSTKGKIGRGKTFFEEAFGSNLEEFQ
ncbi:MAG: hypothetical protein LBE97_01565, partial [Holosporales bacterium]|nr:hypothetical protein [Holosporales bacterium]